MNVYFLCYVGLWLRKERNLEDLVHDTWWELFQHGVVRSQIREKNTSIYIYGDIIQDIYVYIVANRELKATTRFKK